MRTLYILCLSLFLLSCSQENPEKMLNNLNGYWEISEVTSEYIENREYDLNLHVDYIEMQDGNKTGLRTKVQPNIDGTFSTNKSVEEFEAKIENNKLELYYNTAFDSWKETVLKATKDELVMLNEDGIKYTYKKFTPISFD